MQDIRIESTFTVADYRKVAYYNTYGRSFILIGGNLLLILLGISNLVTQSIAGIFGIVFSAICFVYPFFSLVLTSRRIKQRIVKNNIPDTAAQLMVFTDHGLVFTRGEVQRQYSWGEVELVHETASYLLLYANDRRVLAVPKRDLDETGLYHLRALITSKLSFKKYRLKK